MHRIHVHVYTTYMHTCTIDRTRVRGGNNEKQYVGVWLICLLFMIVV